MIVLPEESFLNSKMKLTVTYSKQSGIVIISRKNNNIIYSLFFNFTKKSFSFENLGDWKEARKIYQNLHKEETDEDLKKLWYVVPIS